MSVEEVSTAGLPEPTPLRLAGAALFLDLDGTLAPIAARPQDVGADPRLNGLLARLQTALGGRLAVISGRALADVDRILDGQIISVAAVHGLVRREPGGDVHLSPAHPALPLAAERLKAFAERDSGLLVEDKGLSVALHFRLAQSHAEAARVLARRLASQTGLALQHGDMVEELRTPGPTKGDSVRAYMALAPFQGARPLFLGDDHTDEDGFEAVHGLGGVGVQVGVRGATAARFRLAHVEAVLDWLEAAL